MDIVKFPDRKQWNKVLERPHIDHSKLETIVIDILDDVRLNGDNALKKYSAKFDKVDIVSFAVTRDEIIEASKAIDDEFKKSIQLAKHNIEKFHAAQQCTGKIIETTPGVKCWQKSVPIEKVGLYIPGGSVPLFSTVLMLGIPARIAQCPEIVLCTPPGKDGKISPAILYVADLIGIKNIYKIGGVQAIGAMAYGTETIPKVYKIFGPGNQYVVCAKQIVNRQGVSIDLPAGPSEVAVIADKTSNPVFVAADLLSQAEHGIDSQVVLFTTNEEILDSIIREVHEQLEHLPRKAIASEALNSCRLFVLHDDDELIEMVNEYAPEHLIIASDNAEKLSDKVTNAGSVFLGHLTPESAGDYASGTNHTLPTNGYARIFSGVNLDSFVKKLTFQQISEYGLFNIGPAIENMASHEDLHGHKNAVSLRLKSFLKK